MIILVAGNEVAIEIPMNRSTAKELRPLLADLCDRWIRAALDSAVLVSDDESWSLIKKIGGFFKANGEPLDVETLSIPEVEALFLSQNRTAAVLEKENENHSLHAYEIDGLIAVRLVNIEYFFPGLLTDLSCIDGRNLFLQAHARYLQLLQDDLAEKPQEEPNVRRNSRSTAKKDSVDIEVVTQAVAA